MIQPSLAESWSVSEDGLVWTFNLRQNATWVDYTGAYVANVTANDFVAAAKYILNDANASSTADIVYGVIAGAEEYYNSTIVPAEGEAAPEAVDFETVGVKALDDYTLQYTLYNPCPYFESMLTYVCFMPVYEPFLTEKGAAFGVADGPDSILYCGAYILSEFKPQNIRVLIKNESNWDADKVYITRIESKYNAEASSISAEMYRRGEIDSATITSDTAAAWLADPETEALIRPVRQADFYAFCFEPKFDEAYEPENWKLAANNEAFRQSIYAGINRINVQSIFEPDNPESIIFNTITPPNFVSCDGKDFTQYGELDALTALGTSTYNEEIALAYRDQAIAELTEAGATFPIKVLVKYNPSSSSWANECVVLEQQLEGLFGPDYIDIIVEAGPSTGFLTAVRRSGNYALLKCNWGPDYADPETYTDPFDYDNTYNFMDKGADPELMAEYYALVAEAKAEVTDLDARYEKFAAAEAFLIKHAIVVPLGFGDGGYEASRVDTFSTQFASFGISNYRYKGAKLVDEPMSTDMYFDAYDAWVEERAALAAK